MHRDVKKNKYRKRRWSHIEITAFSIVDLHPIEDNDTSLIAYCSWLNHPGVLSERKYYECKRTTCPHLRIYKKI